VAANASLAANREYQSLEAEVRRTLAEAKAADEAEDGEYVLSDNYFCRSATIRIAGLA